MRAAGRFAQVAAVFTDQDPNVAAVPDLAGERNAVVVPFFASEGWHVGQVAANGATPSATPSPPAPTPASPPSSANSPWRRRGRSAYRSIGPPAKTVERTTAGLPSFWMASWRRGICPSWSSCVRM